MSTSTGNTGNLPQATSAEIDSQIQSAIGAGDTGSAQAIQNLALIHQARLSQLTRAAATLRNQQGADSAETKAAEAAVTAGNARVASMTVLQFQANTPTPEVAATGWALHGRVFKPQSQSTIETQWQPDSDLTVFLADDRQQFQEQYGYSYTDSTGYFLLNNPGGKDHPKASGPLFLHVWNKKKQPVYVDKTAFSPALGTATYKNIFLPDGDKPLGNPPDEVRRGPVPGNKKRSAK